jgi:CheY-like chemotaxis protein
LEEEIKDPDLGSHVRALVHAGELLQSIVSDILDFSKIEAGRFDINPAPTPIAAAIEDIAVLFRPQAEQKGVAFNLIQDPNLPTYISLDGNRLRQIVANLVGNAVKFTHEGFVEIKTMNAPATLGESGRRLVISVRDTGVGISMEAQPDLFKPFTQIRPSLADGQRGTGLGLSIAARLAELMGGRISVTSQPGAGSTFTVDLPLIEADAPMPIAGHAGEKTPTRRLRVLVADDGEINRLILGEFIRREGHDVIFADDGAATVEIAKSELIDLIFMDIAMPHLDGFEATIAIRALPAPYGNVQIIAASATTQDVVQERCLAVGMNGFMPKPIRRPELVAFLEKAAKTAKADGPSAGAVGL